MAQNKTITMSSEEITRSEITQKAGGRRTNVTERHFRRLLSRYRTEGPEGIISGHRGKPSNNRMTAEKKDRLLKKLCEAYQGFGPTLASEKLAQRDDLEVSKETVRQIMIQADLHQPKSGIFS